MAKKLSLNPGSLFASADKPGASWRPREPKNWEGGGDRGGGVSWWALLLQEIRALINPSVYWRKTTCTFGFLLMAFFFHVSSTRITAVSLADVMARGHLPAMVHKPALQSGQAARKIA